MILSVPAVELAFKIASRRVQSPEASTARRFRQVAPVPRGGMSSKRFGKKVGSGNGIITAGAI